MTEKTQEVKNRTAEIWTRALYGVLALMCFGGLVALAWRVYKNGTGPIGAEHAPAVIGLPVAVAVATIVVGLLRALDGQFRLELPGLSVTGAAGALIGWLLCMIGLALATRILW